jgi:minor extracellular serine protease Vpr
MSERLRVRRSRALTAVAAVAALAVTLLAAGAHGAAGSSTASVFESPTGAWFVELSGPAHAFRTNAKAKGLRYTERFEFTRLWHGLSVDADPDTAQLMGKLEGVVAVHPVGVVELDPVERVSDPELIHALAMTGADVAQSELGLSGDGVKVGVMDTGIDYDNPALGGCFGPACRVATGWDFVGDRYNASGSGGDVIPHPDGDPDDCNGHGTHVSGIVGANGAVNDMTLKGVAPGVTFGAYRVFGCSGSTSEDIMIAAMERAQQDGMDVVNMSIGDAFAWDTEPFALAMNAAVAEGTVVVISAGNSGGNGLFSLSSAGNARDVIGVASVDNSHVELKTFTAAPDDQAFGYTQAAAAPDAPTSGTVPLTRLGPTTTANDGCNGSATAPPAGSLTDKWVLIRRGTCTFHEKSLNAQNAGAAGVILYNNVPGLFSPTVAGTPAITIPVVAVSDASGVNLAGRIPVALTSTVDITWTDESGTFPNPTAGLASSFTSIGLTPTLNSKPDIAAPGGLIKSTWPMEQGGFATISGTSMAAPHVAGAAALYLEEHGPTNPLVLRDVLQNSADPFPWVGNPGLGFLEFVHRQGAGLIDIDDAILATTMIAPGKLALGEGTGGTRSVTITNNGTSDMTYDLSHVAALSTNLNTYAPGASTAAASVTFTQGGSSVTSVNVPAGGSVTVDASIAISPVATLADRRIYGGYLTFTGGGTTVRVPYTGFRGDYQSIMAIAPGACTFPGIFKAGGETTCAAGPPAVMLNGWTRQVAGATYNVSQRPDRPILLYHLAHQSESLEIRAVNAADQEFLVARSVFVERNPTNDLTPPGQTSGPGFFTYTWDGKAVFVNEKNGVANRRALPDGTYKLRLVLTKALAEPGNPAHVETWDSPAMVITGGS